ncbi:MAG: F0F1 ATP synthase subunit A [Nitrospirota bacterium]
MEAPLIFHIKGIPPFVIYSWIAMALLITMSLIVRRRLELNPRTVQNVVEAIVEGLFNFTSDIMGEKGRYFFPLIGTLGLYILVCNFMGLIPGFESPTSNLNTTASMAIPVFLATHYYGVRTHGLSYFKHFVGPVWWLAPLMVPIEVIGHLARPVSLSMRLFGNMEAKHLILIVLAIIAPLIAPVVILGLGVLVSIVQAFVFVLLTILYLSGAVEEAEH